MSDSSPRMLIVLTEAIGDVLLSTPLIRAARKNQTEAYIAYLVSEKSYPVLKHNPYLDALIVDEGRKKSIASFLSLIHEVKKHKFSVVLQLTPYRKYHLMAFLARIPGRVGLDHQGWPWTHNRLIEAAALSELHRSEYYLAFAKEMGWQEDGLRLDFRLDSPLKGKTKKTISQAGVGEEDLLIGVHPATSLKRRKRRQWPPDRFRELINRLIRQGFKVILFDGPGYESLVQRIWKAGDDRVLVVKAMDLMTLGAYLEQCDLVISLDSAPAHLTIALERPLVVLFSGVTSPVHWGPRYGSFRIIRKENIEDISVRDVLENVKSLLEADMKKRASETRE